MGAITVTGLGKAYRQYPTRWSRVAEWVLPGSVPRHQLKWVLRDVNFSVRPGEALGIIGINGAGKSTLLKMITGTTLPTEGSIDTRGNIAALLELGMGFHADFTGRQNVFMAGQLLGYSMQELSEYMPRIEAFAEIGDYMDQPVRVYSSGMQMRLAFSVATARRPDVLIVDEALSVGDAYFQHKSFNRIREFRTEGTTLLIVSHDKGAIQSICDRALLLDAGRVAMEGQPEAVMDYYNALLAKRENHAVRQEETASGKLQTVSGSGEAVIADVALLDISGNRVEVVNVGQPVTLRVVVQTRAAIPELVLGYVIKDRLGQSVFGTNTHHMKRVLNGVDPDRSFAFHIHFAAAFGPGTYSVAIALHASDNHLAVNYEWRDLALVFSVANIDKDEFVGVAWLPPRLEVTDDR